MTRILLALLVVALSCGCGTRAAKPAARAQTSPARATTDRCTTGKEAPANEDELEGKTVARICIEGATPEAKQQIDDAFLLDAGSVFAGDTLRADLERIYATNLVDDVRASAYADSADPKKIFLVVHVHERPKIATLTIEGAKANSNDELVKAFPVKSGDVYEPAKLRTLVVDLRDGYRAAGYKSVQIDQHVEPTNDERVNVKLVIKEE